MARVRQGAARRPPSRRHGRVTAWPNAKRPRTVGEGPGHDAEHAGGAPTTCRRVPGRGAADAAGTAASRCGRQAADPPATRRTPHTPAPRTPLAATVRGGEGSRRSLVPSVAPAATSGGGERPVVVRLALDRLARERHPRQLDVSPAVDRRPGCRLAQPATKEIRHPPHQDVDAGAEQAAEWERSWSGDRSPRSQASASGAPADVRLRRD
jgi:hypothetical protein